VICSKNPFVLVLVCLQLVIGSAAGLGVSAHNTLHVATAHELMLDHHHHDDFAVHVGHDDAAGTHAHSGDSFQSVGLLDGEGAKLNGFASHKQPVLLIAQPPDIFLEGLLRPPQILL
jgi:hypothetical protein